MINSISLTGSFMSGEAGVLLVSSFMDLSMTCLIFLNQIGEHLPPQTSLTACSRGSLLPVKVLLFLPMFFSDYFKTILLHPAHLRLFVCSLVFAIYVYATHIEGILEREFYSLAFLLQLVRTQPSQSVCLDSPMKSRCPFQYQLKSSADLTGYSPHVHWL